MTVCVSCGRQCPGRSVTFPCPGCGKEMTRCSDCRQQGNKYKCPECGFTGP